MARDIPEDAIADRVYLMTGGSGRLGKHLRPLLTCDAPSRSQMDVLNEAEVSRRLDSTNYAGIIHLAALTDPRQTAADPKTSYRVNVIGTRHMAQQAARHGLKIFYLSTDYVFDGTVGNYREDDPVAPANWYGFTKYAGELEVQDALPTPCIVRTSFRPSPWGFPTAYTNVFTSADYTDIIAAELLLCIQWNLEGVIHIGTAVKTFFELAQRRTPTVQPEICEDASFPKRRNLNIDRWLSIKREHGL